MDGRGIMVSNILSTSKSISNSNIINPQPIIFNNGRSQLVLNGSANHNSQVINGIPTNAIVKPTKRLFVQNSTNGLVLSSITTNKGTTVPITFQKFQSNTVNTPLIKNGVCQRTNAPPIEASEYHSLLSGRANKSKNSGHSRSNPFNYSQVKEPFRSRPVTPVIEQHDVVTLSDSDDDSVEEPNLQTQPETPAVQPVVESLEEEEPVIDIVINNVVASFALGCHLDLRHIALTGSNVEYRRENGMVTMKLRRPQVTASVWSSGKITCTGSTSETEARIAARRVARTIQKLGYNNVRFKNYRVVNVLGTCSMPFAIKIAQFSQSHRKQASYEPELHPGVTFRIPDPKATLKVFSTGSITVTAPSVGNVQSAIEHIYPLVNEWSKPKTKVEADAPPLPKLKSAKSVKRPLPESDGSEVELISDDDSDDC